MTATFAAVDRAGREHKGRVTYRFESDLSDWVARRRDEWVFLTVWQGATEVAGYGRIPEWGAR